MSDVHEEKWFCWMKPTMTDDGTRLLEPRSNGREYEYPLDGLFKTVEEAVEYLREENVSQQEFADEDYRLCTYEVRELDEQPDVALFRLEDEEGESEDERIEP